MSEFPEPDVHFYVAETFRAGHGNVTEFAIGPFDHPDQARDARNQIRCDDPTRNVHCVEVRRYEASDQSEGVT